MTSVQLIDPNKPFADQLAASSPDPLREMLASFIQSLVEDYTWRHARVNLSI